jgi:hypothetical protein
MYVRWRKRQNRTGESWYVYLCDNQRVEGKPKSQTLGYLGSIRGDLVPLVPARKAFWQQVEENLKPHHLAKSERLKIETAIANRVPKSKTNSNWAALTSKQTIEWYTPPQYVELARQVMGNIDLDPASNELAQTWIKATTFYTAADDGLLKPWYGRVWLNPPYANATGWVDKAIIEYDKGNISEAVLLVKPADGASWYQRLNKRFPRCGANHRIRFMDRDGIAQPRPAHGNCFFYLGKDVSFFGEVFAQVGTITAPI